MKKAILHTLVHLVLGAIACAVLIGSLVLLLAMPDILEWLSGYIGEMMTWTVFLFVVAGIISYCINSK